MTLYGFKGPFNVHNEKPLKKGNATNPLQEGFMKKSKLLTLFGVMLAMGITACGGTTNPSDSKQPSTNPSSQPQPSQSSSGDKTSSTPSSTSSTPAPSPVADPDGHHFGADADVAADAEAGTVAYKKAECADNDGFSRLKINQSAVTYGANSSRKSGTPDGYTKLANDGATMSFKIKADKNESLIYRSKDGHWMEHFEDKKREEVCIDDDIPFGIPNSWRWVRLRSLVSILGDGLHGTPEYDVMGNYYFINGNNLSKNKIVIKPNTEKVNEREYLKYKKELNDKTILISINGTIGNVGHYNGEPVVLGKSACYYNLLDIRLKEYITLLMYTDYFLKYAKDNATGSTIKNVSLAVMNNFFIPLPPLAEQKRIVTKIEELLPKVEEYGKAQEALDKLNEELPEKLKKSILQEAIEGRLVPQDPNDEPASVLLNKIRKEKAELVKEGKLKKKDLEEIPISEDEMPFQIPKSWKWCRFGEILNSFTGKTPERGNADYWSEEDYPWVSISDMKQGETITLTKERISSKAAEKCFSNQISPKGSLIMSFKLTVGRTSFLGIDAYHNEAIITIKTFADSHNYLRNYLSHILPIITTWGDSKDAIKGKTLNSKSIYNLMVPLPPYSEQHRIVSKIEHLMKEIEILKV